MFITKTPGGAGEALQIPAQDVAFMTGLQAARQCVCLCICGPGEVVFLQCSSGGRVTLFDDLMTDGTSKFVLCAEALHKIMVIPSAVILSLTTDLLPNELI